jgi:hypothetical protein
LTKKKQPAELLEAAAKALTACHKAGLDLTVKHGILSCPEGLILPLDDGSFVARTRIFTEFSRSDDNEDLLIRRQLCQ